MKITHRDTGLRLWEGEAGTVCVALSLAVRAGANLQGADLREADLWEADLQGADLQGADLRGTVCDPSREATCADADLAGLVRDGDFVEGWRTFRSQHVGDTEYRPGLYRAPVFSVCPQTACHPGLYFDRLDKMQHTYPGIPLVRVRVRRADIQAAGGKLRARAFEVLAETHENGGTRV